MCASNKYLNRQKQTMNVCTELRYERQFVETSLIHDIYLMYFLYGSFIVLLRQIIDRKTDLS